MKKRLVLVGAGHAHLTILKHLHRFVQAGHEVMVISPSPHQYYSGMGPGMLAGIYSPDDIRFPVKQLTESGGGKFCTDVVTRVDPENRTLFCQSGKKVSYDLISFNVGSGIASTVEMEPDDTIFPVKPIESLIEAKTRLLSLVPDRKNHVTVVGGGAAGVEIAGCVHRLVADHRIVCQIRLLAGKRLLARFPEKVRKMGHSALTQKNIHIIEGPSVVNVSNQQLTLSDGTILPSDITLLATGTQPGTIFSESGLTSGQDPGLAVNASLQSIYYPDIFGGGDCIHFLPSAIDRVGVYAVRQNPILYHNLMACLSGGHLKSFIPQKSVLLILNLGDHTGIAFKNRWVWNGKSAFRLKDYIDRRFMKRFQMG